VKLLKNRQLEANSIGLKRETFKPKNRHLMSVFFPQNYGLRDTYPSVQRTVYQRWQHQNLIEKSIKSTKPWDLTKFNKQSLEMVLHCTRQMGESTITHGSSKVSFTITKVIDDSWMFNLLVSSKAWPKIKQLLEIP
jgi:hypothetical protein